MPLRRLLLSLLLALGMSGTAFAGLFTGQEEILKGLDLSYQLRFADARAVFAKLAEEHPDSPAGRFYLAAIGWGMTESDLRWRYLARQFSVTTPPKKEVRGIKALEADLNGVIALCESLVEKEPNHFEGLFYMAGAHAFLARMSAYRGNWFDAMYHGKKSTALFDRLYAAHPQEGDAMIGPAIYKYYVGRLAVPMQWLIRLLGLDGSREEGLALAEKAYAKALLSRMEAADFLARINWMHEGAPRKALEWASAEERIAPASPAAELNRLFAWRQLGDRQKQEAALRRLQVMLAAVDAPVRAQWEPLIEYAIGSLREERGDKRGAAAQFRKTLAAPELDPWLKGEAELKLRRVDGKK